MGARSTQVLPPAAEIDDAISRVREIFHLEKGSKTAADRFLHSLSGFINGLDTKNNVKVGGMCLCMRVCAVDVCVFVCVCV